MKLELIADSHCQIGENPLWHPQEKRLYWTDITGGKLFCYNPATQHHEVIYHGASVGGFTIQVDGSLLLFMESGRIARWRAGRLSDVRSASPAELDSRFNDVISDPRGRVFCGTVSIPAGERPGRLYRLDPDGLLHVLLEGIGISNGMGFTPDHRHMYYTDSLAGKIYQFDYDPDSGALTNQRTWLKTPAGAGEPDGLTVDAEGYVWSARWGDSAIYRYTSEGSVDRRIELPAKKVSSVTFGGDDLSDLYITTALNGGAKTEEGSGAGALFRLRPGVRGLPEHRSRIMI